MHNTGKLILIIGLLLVVVGGLIWAFGNIFSWLGNLPGDIRIRRENFHLYIPITTMILVSAFITLLFWVVKRFL
ncbi:MAG: DUF2905 domain-containing protein [Bacteroidota bacterium]